MLRCPSDTPAFSFDVANLTRQVLGNLFLEQFAAYEKAYNEGSRSLMVDYEDRLICLLDDIDLITGTQEAFLLGKWIGDARAWGSTPEEADYFESNARNLLTTWSGEDMLLNDYASRMWNGLVSSFYKVRWTMFFDAVNSALNAGETFDEEHYEMYRRDVTAFEGDWWRNRRGTFSAVPSGDAPAIAARLCEKYAPYFNEEK